MNHPHRRSPSVLRIVALHGDARAARVARVAVAVALLAAGAAAAPAVAQIVLPPPEQVVHLSASATIDVEQDWLTITFSTTLDGADAAEVQARLKQALDTALAQAREAARPGAVEVSTGRFSLRPRHAAPPSTPRPQPTPPRIVGWTGTAELVVEGRDVAAISQLAGRIESMTVGDVGFSLSRPAREKVEQQVEAGAIANFRARADAVSRQFGYAGYTLREVTVASDPPPVRPTMWMQSARIAADESLPVASGRSAVTATVSGSVQMRR